MPNTLQIDEYIDGIVNVSGNESEIEEAISSAKDTPVYLNGNTVDFNSIKSAFCAALHMHQPLVPAGGHDLRTATIISNLQYMMENQGIGDNHNAPSFHWCYKRIGEFIPQLIDEGKEPRIMLEYSGALFHGLRHMGLHDVIDTLKHATCDPRYSRGIEWLGCPWGHAVAPSTPSQDFRLHVKAWQQHFASIFGIEALQRVRGFSPSEMALPNHPDVAYEYIKTLTDCGYQWLMVQEHTVELPENGHHPQLCHIPHRLVCKNSKGEEASIIALIKTQGSDTKLVAQMQPYYEAMSLSKVDFAGKQVPPLVSQIADGENGGVMMNEFPDKFFEASRNSSHSDTPIMSGTEYLEHFLASGIQMKDFPTIQPVKQHLIWSRINTGDGPEQLEKAIEEAKKEDSNFHMDGGSWTDDISWVNGYDNVLGPMEKVSHLFSENILKKGIPTNDNRYRNALYHLMSSQTSCYRYWGQGQWTDYGIEICRRAEEIINSQ